MAAIIQHADLQYTYFHQFECQLNKNTLGRAIVNNNLNKLSLLKHNSNANTLKTNSKLLRKMMQLN